MDVTTCLKSLLMAVHQYRENRTALNAAQLQKQVEMSTVRCVLWSSEGHLQSQCVNALMELIGNTNTCQNLVGSIVSLLTYLACDGDSQLILHSSFSLISSVTAVVLHCSEHTLLVQCLQLLQKLTYNTATLPPTNHLHQLLRFIISTIQSHTDDIIIPCLGLMANLCRENQSVQAFVRSQVSVLTQHIRLMGSALVCVPVCVYLCLFQDSVRSFYRTLLNFLDHSSLTVVVFSLSVLTSLSLGEKVGEKLFGPKNIHQTFQLVFNIILNGDRTVTRKYSVDLLIDLIKSPKIAEHLSRYAHFSTCVTQVSALLENKEPDSATKVLELLLALSVVPSLLPLLRQIFFKPVAPKLGALGNLGGREPGGGQHLDVGLTLVQWLSSPVEGAESCLLQALRLLRELLEGALSGSTLSFVGVLLPVVMELLKESIPSGDDDLVRVCRRSSTIISLLLVLCSEEKTRSLLTQHISAQLCLHQVETLLSCCHGNQPLTCAPPGTDGDLSQLSSHALIQTLKLMSHLRQDVPHMETSFYRVLQDQRTVTPLCVALMSPVALMVHSALSLLFEASSLPDFPAVLMGEGIAANNAFRQRSTELSLKHLPVQEIPPLSTVGVEDSNKSVSCLVEKIKDGLEVKDSCVSEIIDVYEQKLSALATKENHLQELLNSKSSALSQADRIIAQFGVQRAQTEAERSRLCALLKASERRKEQLQAELSYELLMVQRSKTDTEDLLQHNQRLQRDSEQHQELREAYNALLLRLSDSEQQLKDLQTLHQSLTKSSDAQKRSYEALQLLHNKVGVALAQAQCSVESLQEQIQRKQTEFSGVCEQLQQQQLELQVKEEQLKELQVAMETLKKDLIRTEQSRRDTSIKASSLELQKDQLEVKLKSKEDELNKHSAMIAMIHSLSSGKKSDVNLSL
ncbi:protein CIP2A isoform X2 [Gouania willdenowi]|uniref:protein CIP2A isoform X2 n=1 Tax=Gouania willdenowi TaxID=441366 RepID=UPI001056DBD6|nr:protein CIP2A isoform X2 [Gouania willdenowi]